MPAGGRTRNLHGDSPVWTRVRLARRDEGKQHLMALGFAEEVTPLIEGELMGRLDLKLRGRQLMGTFEDVESPVVATPHASSPFIGSKRRLESGLGLKWISTRDFTNLDFDFTVLADAEMTKAPTGEIAIIFTDVEGSTALWDRIPDAMHKAIERHDELYVDSWWSIGVTKLNRKVTHSWRPLPRLVMLLNGVFKPNVCCSPSTGRAYSATNPSRVRKDEPTAALFLKDYGFEWEATSADPTTGKTRPQVAWIISAAW